MNSSPACTYFPNQYADSLRTGFLNLDIISNAKGRSKASLPWIKLARFSGELSPNNCYRHDAGVASVTGAEFHTSLMRLAARYAALGHRHGDIIELLRGFMNSSTQVDSSRWRDRYKEIERIVDSAMDKFKPNEIKESNVYRFTRQGIGFDATFVETVPDPVPFIISGLLPQTSFGIAGAGGSLKSTTMLRIMMHVGLGKTVFDREVLQPGPCVFVSAEDDLRTIRFRVRMMADGMGLTPRERKQLARDLLIEDASGSIARLVEQDNRGNLHYAVAPQKYPVPDAIRELMLSKPSTQVVQLHIPKISFAKAPVQSLWIARDPIDMWCFHDVWGETVGAAAQVVKKEESELAIRLVILKHIWDHLTNEQDADRHPNKTTLREQLIVKIDDRKVGKQRLSDMVELGILHGFIKEDNLPMEKKQGTRKYFLAPATEPFIGSGGLGE